jgi:anti-sigma factor RsiW
MHCSRVKNLLSAYSDRELRGDEMLAIRRHLGDCPDCRQEHDRYQQVKQLFRGLAEIVPDRGFDVSLLDRTPVRRPSATPTWLETLRDQLEERFDALRRWSRRMFPTFHNESQLVAVTCLSIAIVAALALQRPQPADAVSAHVPEILTTDYDEAAPGAQLVGYGAGNNLRTLGVIGPDGRLYLFRPASPDPATDFRNEPYWKSPNLEASLASHRR